MLIERLLAWNQLDSFFNSTYSSVLCFSWATTRQDQTFDCKNSHDRSNVKKVKF